jgi:hypothetical protein
MVSPLNRRRYALSSVVSSIILSATVLVVGGAVWSYAKGASSVIATQYHTESMDLVKQVQERFMVEHVTNTLTSLTVYVYNYGDVDVEVDIYAINGSMSYHTDFNNPLSVQSKSSAYATIDMPCDLGDIISVKIYSRRQNIVYYTYIAK